MLQHLFLQAQAPQGGGFAMLFPLVIFLVFFVFFIFIPQNRQRKAQQKLMESLKEGMEVVTQSGIVGKITKVEDKTVRLMVDEKTFLHVLKASISGEFQK
jgi:preprotein translocase subunit YajC